MLQIIETTRLKKLQLGCKINVVVINVVKCNEIVFCIETKKM